MSIGTEFSSEYGVILDIISDLASREVQERLWTAIEPTASSISSPTEMVCQLMDDAEFGEFLHRYRAEIGKSRIEAAAQLMDAIEKLSEEIDRCRPVDVLDREDWGAVRQSAANLLNIWLHA